MNFEWKDVANYYLESNIRIDSKWGIDTFDVRWLRDFDYQDGRPILRHLEDDETKECFWMDMGNAIAHEFHFLISHGFDLFGLIESGQAIRKENA